MLPWKILANVVAEDGTPLQLRQRGDDFTIRAGAHELMSNGDESSSRSLATLGCAHLAKATHPRVLIGGLGMGFTLRATLDCLEPKASVEVSELVSAVVDWNREILGTLAQHPLNDARARVCLGDVGQRIRSSKSRYDAILLDVDNGPIALAHESNSKLYSRSGLQAAHRALKPGGILGVWSLLDDARFTARLRSLKFDPEVHLVNGSRKNRGKRHVIWVARAR